MKVFDPENLVDYIWMWFDPMTDRLWKYQFMDHPVVFKSVVNLINWLKSLRYYNDYELDNLKACLAYELHKEFIGEMQ